MDADLLAAHCEALRQRGPVLPSHLAGPPLSCAVLPLALVKFNPSLHARRGVAAERRAQQLERLAPGHVVEVERRCSQSRSKGARAASLMTTVSGMIVAANQAAALLLNVPLQFLVGRRLALFFPETEQSRLYDELIQLRHQGWWTTWDARLQPYQGSLIAVAVSITAERNHRGHVVALRWLVHNSTHARQPRPAE